MSEELKSCPFCGGKAVTSTFFDWDDLEYMAIEVNDSESIDGEVTCENERCINGWYLPPEIWNTRPIEDALNDRIAELEALVERLIEAGDRLSDSEKFFENLDKVRNMLGERFTDENPNVFFDNLRKGA